MPGCYMPSGPTFIYSFDTEAWGHYGDEGYTFAGVTHLHNAFAANLPRSVGVAELGVPPLAWGEHVDAWDNTDRKWTLVAPTHEQRFFALAGEDMLVLDWAGLSTHTFGERFSGADLSSVGVPYVTRRCFAVPMAQERPPDASTRKFLRSIWPRVAYKFGDKMTVEVQTLKTINDQSPVSKGSKTFQFAVDRKVNFLASGEVFNVTFKGQYIEAEGRTTEWILSGFDLDVVYGGNY